MSDTTDWRFSAVELAAGVVLVASVGARSRWPRHGVPAGAMAALTAAVVFTFGRLA